MKPNKLKLNYIFWVKFTLLSLTEVHPQIYSLPQIHYLARFQQVKSSLKFTITEISAEFIESEVLLRE